MTVSAGADLRRTRFDTRTSSSNILPLPQFPSTASAKSSLNFLHRRKKKLDKRKKDQTNFHPLGAVLLVSENTFGLSFTDTQSDSQQTAREVGSDTTTPLTWGETRKASRTPPDVCVHQHPKGTTCHKLHFFASHFPSRLSVLFS